MDNEEIQGVKFSEFPSATPDNADEIVGLHSDNNARFPVANFILAIRQGLTNLFVPTSRTVNGKALSSDITLDSTDVGARPDTWTPSAADVGARPDDWVPDAEDVPYDNTGSGLSASDVQAALDELATGGGGGGPSPATATPVMDGAGAVGSSLLYAREDHEHPSDTAKQDAITASGMLKGDGLGGVSAAVAGTDYQTPLAAGTDYATPGMIPTVPSISTSTPQMDGVGAAGSTGQVSDAGHTHPSDTSKANQSQIAYVESGTTASQNYYIGQYFNLGGKTYQVITPISSGESFTENVNCKISPITDHLINMTSNISLVNMEYGSGVMGINLRMKDGTLRLLEVYDNGQPELRLRTFNGSAWSTAWSIVADLDSPFHESAVMEGLVNCNSCSTPLEVYQILKASPNATGYGTIGNQQTSQLKNFLSNPYLNYTNVTFQFVSTGLIRCTARNSSDGTVLGKVCYLKGLINNIEVAANWSVTAWEELLPTIAYKEVELGTNVLGTSLSQTSRLIGQCTALFGVAATAILSIGVADASLSPASILHTGTYNDGFYIAASQTCTLSSSVKFRIIYTK